MITIQLDAIAIELAEARQPNGDRIAVVIYTDPQTGIRLIIPHDTNSARVVAAHLDGRRQIQVANGIPPMPL